MDRLKIAIIGCGVVTQTRHLPALMRLRNRFEVTALCDVDLRALQDATQWAPNSVRFTSTTELFSRSDLFDSVLIASSGDHVAEVSASANAHKHIFIEKPLALTAEQARLLTQLIHTAGVACVIGYMKRYSPAVREALRLAHADPCLRMATCDLVHPPEDDYLRVTLGRTRQHDGSLLGFVRQEVTHGNAAAALERTLGSGAPTTARVGHFLLATSVIHDINLLRAALGDVSVVNAHFWNEGLSGQATLRNSAGAGAVLTYAFVGAGSYDEKLTLVGDTTRCAVSFPSPYLLHSPVRFHLETLEIGTTPDRSAEETFHDDIFGLELTAFHEHVTSNKSADTPPQEALDDLELVASIARAAAQLE